MKEEEHWIKLMDEKDYKFFVEQKSVKWTNVIDRLSKKIEQQTRQKTLGDIENFFYYSVDTNIKVKAGDIVVSKEDWQKLRGEE